MKVARESLREVAKRAPSPAAALGAAAALGCSSCAAGQLWCSSAAQLRCACTIVECLWYGLGCSSQEFWNPRMPQAMAFFSAHRCSVSKCIFTTYWTSNSEHSKAHNQFFLPSDLTSSKEMAHGQNYCARLFFGCFWCGLHIVSWPFKLSHHCVSCSRPHSQCPDVFSLPKLDEFVLWKRLPVEQQ